jgi:nucleoside-diphosphate-sugar epimerase
VTLKVVILGANGFIGSALTSAILRTRPWHVYAMDLNDNKLAGLSSNPRFHFVEGDVSINREWIEYHVKKCDVVVPLVAIANPAQYVTDPLRVFELDFEANLEIVRLCVQYRKRLIFPSTSEVYGMAADPVLDEEESPFVYGPIHKQRWIYAASKQLLDRVIYAYGVKAQLDYTLIRPFNFIGPNLDNIEEPKEGSSRVFTQFLSNVMHRLPIKLVDGGEQKRSFTYIDDAIDCILRILENTDRVATRRIFNIGHPGNCVSVAELARRIVRIAAQFPQLEERARATKIVAVSSKQYYGVGYQDIQVRVPAVEAARRILGWTPTTDLDSAIHKTIAYYVAQGTGVFPAAGAPVRADEEVDANGVSAVGWG